MGKIYTGGYTIFANNEKNEILSYSLLCDDVNEFYHLYERARRDIRAIARANYESEDESERAIEGLSLLATELYLSSGQEYKGIPAKEYNSKRMVYSERQKAFNKFINFKFEKTEYEYVNKIYGEMESFLHIDLVNVFFAQKDFDRYANEIKTAGGTTSQIKTELPTANNVEIFKISCEEQRAAIEKNKADWKRYQAIFPYITDDHLLREAVASLGELERANAATELYAKTACCGSTFETEQKEKSKEEHCSCCFDD